MSKKQINNSSSDKYIQDYLDTASLVISQLNKQDIEKVITKLIYLKENKGRLFLLGVGGSAANCSHAVNDFRKIAGIEAYSPTDNIAEITARTNDDGWETVFINWLKVSKLNKNDAVMILSVGGGNIEKNTSINIVRALEYAKEVKTLILGIVSKDGGFTKKMSAVCLMIPVIKDEFVTPFAESLQALIWHLIINHPKLKDHF